MLGMALACNNPRIRGKRFGCPPNPSWPDLNSAQALLNFCWQNRLQRMTSRRVKDVRRTKFWPQIRP